VLAVAVVLAGACSAAPDGPVQAAWIPVGGDSFAHADVAAALAGTGTAPWLVGGAVGGRVAIWSAGAAAGPWRLTAMAPVSGDGPDDTILGLARVGTVGLAFGNHPSPIHGNPRPSPWTSTSPFTAWNEIPTLRELFGGENIVGLGGVAGGPHGFEIAGTWIDAGNRAVATVWTSADGRAWTRNDHDPELAGRAGELTTAADVADAPSGLVAVGAALVMGSRTGAQVGAVWGSQDGRTWSRVDPGDRALGASDGQVELERVRPLGAGWIAAGVSTAAGRSRVLVWTWGPAQRLVVAAVAPALPAGANLVVSDVAVTSSAVLVAAVAGGRPLLWMGPVDAMHLPGRWRPVAAPSAGVPAGLRAVLVATDGGSTVLVLRGLDATALWRAALG